MDATLDACEPALDRWWSAARHGLADRVLARAATAVFELACATAPDARRAALGVRAAAPR